MTKTEGGFPHKVDSLPVLISEIGWGKEYLRIPEIDRYFGKVVGVNQESHVFPRAIAEILPGPDIPILSDDSL